MKKKDIKYFIILISMFVLYILVETLSPPPVNWQVTFDENHKIPFGTYAVDQLLPEIFEGKEITHSNATIYDLYEEDIDFKNLLIICNSFTPSEEDEEILFEMLEEGKHVFIAADWFSGKFFDSLKISVSHSITRSLSMSLTDTSMVYMSSGFSFPEMGPFKYMPNHSSLFFYSFDSTRADVLATNSHKDPCLIRYQMGEGSLILSTLPMAFTNYYFLKEDNHWFIANSLSMMPAENLHLTNYYQYGRLEPISKLRFILTNPSLTWAYYLVIAGLIIFMLFESKRRQRPIPVIKPPENSTLNFIDTIGNLYFNQGNNKNIASKKITYFLDFLRRRYYLKTDKLDSDFAMKLAQKTNRDPEEVKELVKLITQVEQIQTFDNASLVMLNNKIEEYYAS